MRYTLASNKYEIHIVGPTSGINKNSQFTLII